MVHNTYISTKGAVRQMGLSTQEIYCLIHDGTLPVRKAPKSGWRIFSQSLSELKPVQAPSFPEYVVMYIDSFVPNVRN